MPKYKDIVEKELEIKDDFLLEEERGETIHTRLKSAYGVMKNDQLDSFSNRDIFAINQCVHLATSIVLLGSDADRLENTMHKTKTEFPNSDPNSVITIATLYYLLTNYMGRQNEKIEEIRAKFTQAPQVPEVPKEEPPQWQTIVQYIRERFDAVNWMIGQEGMKTLGIEMVKKDSNS